MNAVSITFYCSTLVDSAHSYTSIRCVMFNNVIKTVPEFYHENNEKKLTYLVMHEWKYVSYVLDEAWPIRTQTFYNR